MNLNIKLRIFFEEYIKSKKAKTFRAIEGIPHDDASQVLMYLAEIMQDNVFFIYKEGSTKFNSELKIVLKANIINYLISGYKVYSIDTLDFIMVGEYEGHDGKEEIKGVDIDCSGKFEKYLIEISDNFGYKIREVKQ